MQPDESKRHLLLKWIEIAKADFAMASINLPQGARYENLCFNAQQAAEKSLKIVLIKYDIEFPYTHDLQRLFDLIPTDLTVPPELFGATDLTHYAVTTRYPDEEVPLSEDEWREAVTLAGMVLDWALKIINEP